MAKTEFDFKKLGEIVELEVKALNRVVDVNQYVDDKSKRSSLRHRPIAIGIQGLQDVFFKLYIQYSSEKARELNRKIFETMYYHAIKASMELAKVEGPYETFAGSPASEGKLQFDLWGKDIKHYGLMGFDWDTLKSDVMKYGLRNSTLIALMPTASTSIIMNNTECMEPITSNIYKKKLLAGEFVIINRSLIKRLIEKGLWNDEMKQLIIAMDGSIQHIPGIPYPIRSLYKTVWELKQRVLIDLAIDRSPYVCQSQSMNLYFDPPNPRAINGATMYAWEQGLKTWCYYTRTKPATKAVAVTVSEEIHRKAEELMEAAKDPEYCLSCTG